MGEAAQRHPGERIHHSARLAVHANAGNSPGDSRSLSFLRPEPLHTELDLQMRTLRSDGHLLGHRTREPHSQSPRSELLDGDADWALAGAEFPCGKS